MTSVPRSPYQIFITLLLFLAALAWGLLQLQQRPVNGKGLSSDWLNVQTWLMPLANHAALERFQSEPVNFLKVQFIDSQHGWVVTSRGLLSTTDGGGNWRHQQIAELSGITSVYFTDLQHGWVIGSEGRIFATENGGASWYLQHSSNKQSFHAIHFIDPQHGWVVGEQITEQQISGGGYSITIDKSLILFTNDGGQNWHEQAVDNKTQLRAIHVNADGQRAWVVGDGGIILITSNGGQSWQKQNSGVTDSFNSVHFNTDGQRGWVVGYSGTLATSNGGQNWEKQNTGVADYFNSVYFSADGQRGWLVGQNGTILATRNSGQSWQKQNSGVADYFNSVYFSADGQRGWVVGSYGTILSTSNGGQSWQTNLSKVNPTLSQLFFIDPQRGWAVGSDGVVLETHDGGQTWQAQESGVTESLTSVHFNADGQRGWVAGLFGTILTTTNGGQSWQKQDSGVKELLNSVHFNADGQRGWVVGYSGTILATRNGGQSWQKQTGSTEKDIFMSMYFDADGQHGWVVGWQGTILATRNGGQSWQKQNSGVKEYLNSVHFNADGQRGWVVGQKGTILATSNGGQSWQKQIGHSEKNNFASVYFDADGQHGWVIDYSDEGVSLTTSDGGQSWQQWNNVPKTQRVQFIDGQHIKGVTNNLVYVSNDGGVTWQTYPIAAKTFVEGRKLAVYPSPLVLLLLFLSGASVVVQVYRYYSAPRHLGGVSDTPIDSADADVLGRGELVKTLANLIRNRDTVPPLAIAITAAWGSGKSSLLALLQAELQGEAIPVTLNAWHYKDDSTLLAALMAHIREALPPLLSLDNALFRLRLLWIRCFSGAGWRYGFGLSLAIAAGVYFASLKNWHNLNDWLQRESATLLPSWLEPLKQQAWLQLLVLLVSAVLIYRLLKSWLAAVSAFSPELVALLTQLGKPAREAMQVADWSKDAGLRFRFAQDFNDITNALGKGRLLLLIDDLDRCEAKQIESVMATLNFLFSSPAPCYAVLAMDWDYVTKALGFAFKDLVIINAGETAGETETKRGDFASRYLEKIIQIRINLPSVNSSAVALHDRSQTNTNTVKNWWGCLKNRWTWLQSAPRYRFRLPWAVAFVLLWCLTLLWRGVEAILWLSWQAVKSFNSKMLTPIYDIVLIVLLATGLMWSVVEVGAWAQNNIPLEIKTESPVVTATPATPEPAKPDAKPALADPKSAKPAPANPKPEKIESKATSSPVVMIDEPLYPTDYGLEGLAGIFALFLVLMVWRLSLRLQDTRVFLEVMTEWLDFLAKHHATPRDWKRLLNRARLFSMRVRVSVEKPWYASFDERWTRGRFVTTSVSTDETVLDERLAMHLMMLDVFAKGKIVKDLPSLLEEDAGTFLSEFNRLDNGVCSWTFFPVLQDFFKNLHPNKKATPEGIQARARFKTWLSLYAGLNS